MKLTTTAIDNFTLFFTTILVSFTFKKSDALSVSHQAFPATKSSSNRIGSIARNVHGSNLNQSVGKGIPTNILAEIQTLDRRLKCFPKLLCNIYQDDSIAGQGFLNVTELGVAYIKLVKAVHYKSPTGTPSTTEATIVSDKNKRPIIQFFQIPMGLITAATYPGRKEQLYHSHDLLDDYDEYPPLRSPAFDKYRHRKWGHEDDYSVEYDDNDEYSARRVDDDDRAYLREKLEISDLMKDLINEDKAEMADDSNSHGGSGSLTSSLLSSFLPFASSRSMRKRSFDLDGVSHIASRSKRGTVRISHSQDKRQRKQLHKTKSVSKDPFWKAIATWKKLKNRSQCGAMYSQCPFEAWEIVRMLDLVKGQSKILSAYLKLTVDKVRSKGTRQ